MLQWAPDSKSLVAFRVEQGDRKEVFLVESSPSGGGRANLRSSHTTFPGDKLTSYELYVFNIDTKKRIKTDVEKIDLHFPRLTWNRDGRHFTYEKVDRGHQRFRLIEVDAHTGKSRNLIDEKTETFIWTAHTENVDLERVNWLRKRRDRSTPPSATAGGTCTWSTPRTAAIKNQITKGE